MSQTPIFVCRVQTPEGFKDYATLVEPEVAFAHGLAPEAIVGLLLRPLQEGESITPDVFARNRPFVDLLHAVIAREGLRQPGLLAEARRQGNGWVYVIDQRTPTPGGQVPVEDILGGFEVKGGDVMAGSYRPNPQHRILSANGFFRLDAGLREVRSRCSGDRR